MSEQFPPSPTPGDAPLPPPGDAPAPPKKAALSDEEKAAKIAAAKAKAAAKKAAEAAGTPAAPAEAGASAGLSAPPAGAPTETPAAAAPAPPAPAPPPTREQRRWRAENERAAAAYERARAALERQFGAGPEAPVAFPEVSAGDRPVVVTPARLHDVLAFLRAHPDLDFDALMCQTAFDDGEALHATYHLFSYRLRHRLYVRADLPRAGAELPTVTDLWAVAGYFEREIWDGYGLRFLGHPDLRRIMNPEDWEGHPMLKDYVYPEQYHGVATWREHQFFGIGK